MLLYKQDRLSELEARFEQIDRREPKVLFHGSRRRDGNSERLAILKELDVVLEEYGKQVLPIHVFEGPVYALVSICAETSAS